MRVVGGDPGANTGLVCLELPRTWRLRDAVWVASAVMRPSDSIKLTPAERDGNFYARLTDALNAWCPQHIVLEEPLDAAGYWGADRRGTAHIARSTQFRLGASYGLLASAAYRTGAKVTSYPVNQSGRRPGWMRGVKRTTVLTRMAALAASLMAPAEVYALDKDNEYRQADVLMALGVLAHHCAQQVPNGAAA